MTIPQDELFWTRRTPFSGGAKAYSSPEELWDAACEAFNWLHAHPLREQVLFHNKGEVIKTFQTKMRPFTWGNVSMLMGMTENGLKRYREVPMFAEVMEVIETVMNTQKFEGAASGLLNANIISRDLGLIDKQQVDSKTTVVIEGDEANL